MLYLGDLGWFDDQHIKDPPLTLSTFNMAKTQTFKKYKTITNI
jgi:hypothetical protein